MKKKILLIGAGSAQFGYGMLGDILQSRTLEGSTIVLHDINEITLAEVTRKAAAFIQDKKLPYTVESAADRRGALQDADFVVISIEAGDRFALWEMDRTVPQQYGITQVYGENGGPGGIFHSLRIIPPILEICGDVERICPDAMVFCYSNPLTAICTTVHRAYPGLRFYGLCHEIASLKRYLPAMLETAYENLELTAGGLNHFSVLLKAGYVDSGKDAYPDILTKAPRFFETLPGYSDMWRERKKNSRFAVRESSEHREIFKDMVSEKPWADRGVFRQVLEDFELLPITVDSHFGEYIGWAHDVADHKGILDFLELYKDMLQGGTHDIELVLKERIVPILEGVITGSGYREEAINLPNDGLIEELPGFVAVEVPARIDGAGIHGEKLPALPAGYAALLRNYTGVYDLTAEAVLTKSRKAVIQAILVNPVVTKAAGVRELVDLMISMQPEWLGYLA